MVDIEIREGWVLVQAPKCLLVLSKVQFRMRTSRTGAFLKPRSVHAVWLFLQVRFTTSTSRTTGRQRKARCRRSSQQAPRAAQSVLQKRLRGFGELFSAPGECT